MIRWVWGLTIVMVMASAVSHILHLSSILTFIFCCAAIIPLAGLMGRSTEAIAAHAGPRVGGLLSATFGNAVELIIGFFALREGLTTVVKASITGSILGNLLLVLGVSFFVGGMKHPIQRFNIRAARSNASMLLLGVGIAFAVPSIFISGRLQSGHVMSMAVTVVSLLVYLMGLYFSLFTHRDLFASIESVGQPQHHGEATKWQTALLFLVITTVLVGIESEWLVSSLHVMGSQLGLSELFMGVVVIAVVGNAAEHASAVWMAWKNRMDLSLEIAVGSSLQVAMFVAPILFLTSLVVHHPMPLLFSGPELMSMGAAVIMVVVLMVDGESNWLEGAMAVGAYALIAVGFYTL